MTNARDGDDTKQVLAMIISVVMIYKTDFSQMSTEQVTSYTNRITDLGCDIAEQLDQKFKARGWDK